MKEEKMASIDELRNYLGITLYRRKSTYTILGGKTTEKPVGSLLTDFCNYDCERIRNIIINNRHLEKYCNDSDCINSALSLLSEMMDKDSSSEIASLILCIFEEDAMSYMSMLKTKDPYSAINKLPSIPYDEISQYLFYRTNFIKSYTADMMIGNLFLISTYWIMNMHNLAVRLLESLVKGENADEITNIFGSNVFDLKDVEYRIKNIENYGLAEVLTIRNIKSLLIVEVCNILKEKMIIKRCKNCNRWFVPEKRSDAIYCDSPSPQDMNKTCKSMGAAITRSIKEKEDELTKLYRSIYMSKQMNVKRNPNVEDYKIDFGRFKNEVKQWKAEIKDGTKTEDEYVKWLKIIKGRKVL